MAGTGRNNNDNVGLLQQQSMEIAQLKESLEEYQRYEKAGTLLRPEIKTLYPGVRSLTLTPATEATIDTMPPKKYVLAVVKLDANHWQSQRDREIMTQWLKARVSADSLVMVTRRE